MTHPTPSTPESRETRFRAVFAATYPDLLRFAQRRVHPSHAEDVVADAFLVAWRRLDDVPVDVADARPWLFGVVRATLLNARRGDRRRDALATRIGDGVPLGASDDAEVAAEVAARLDLQRGWARLDPAEQEVIALSVWDGLTSAQAASVLGCTATAYRLRLSRARRALRRHLDHPARTTLPEGARP
ncbi:sigma-70 family RNA polymerase sigma factor [uncultured Nocardioides sp.]|uniref:RNA polymerase sigma factor n=1 Tax=uncultured Nocardioides sp. TaxID=198441 RepID=UPI00260BE151|nr:sigma-70 family RNA polymerase sigma factor [uncultured Nocardioides sp.]